MKERPILFSAPMVLAVLEDRKNQTRRTRYLEHVNDSPDDWEMANPKQWASALADNGCDYGRPITDEDIQRKAYQLCGGGRAFFRHKESRKMISLPCPYGRPGDRLWSRETWAPVDEVAADPSDGAIYRADHTGIQPGRWRPSIHMPRWASRITLETVSVRVERLQDISVEDARAEGCEHPLKGTELESVPGDYVADERTSFAILWQSINGKGSWAENPWVWRIEFRRVEA